MTKSPSRLFYRGAQYELHELVINGKSLVQAYIEKLGTDEQQKIIALLKRAGDHGPPKNPEKFKKLRDGIFEFKSYQTRIFCTFHSGRMIILIHGVTKKKDRHDPEDIDKAIRLFEQAGYERKS